MAGQSKYTRTDRLLIGLGLLLTIIPMVLLMDTRWLREKPKGTINPIGQIEHSTHDVRIRPKGTFSWGQAANKETLFQDDSVFCGDNSTARIHMADGRQIELQPKSLVIFRTEKGVTLPSLESGTFRLKVAGETKLLINGVLTTIEGSDAEVEIQMSPDRKATTKLVKGQATLSNERSGAVHLDHKPMVIETRQTVLASRALPKLAEPAATATPHLAAALSEINYTWKAKDLYAGSAQELVERSPEYRFLSVQLKAAYKAHPFRRKIQVQVSDNIDFTTSRTFSSDSELVSVENLLPNEAYLRASYDGTTWSQPERFVIHQKFASGTPSVTAAHTLVTILEDNGTAPISLQSTTPTSGYVVQASSDPGFLPDKTRTFFSDKAQFNLMFYQAGSYHYRFRSVNLQDELSDWSTPVTFAAIAPEKPQAPTVLQAKTTGRVGEVFSFQFQNPNKQFAVRTEVIGPNGELLQTLNGRKTSWSPQKAGRYELRTYAMDKYNRKAYSESPIAIDVGPRPAPLAVAQQKAPPEEREPAAALPVATTKLVAPVFLNSGFEKSILAIQGFIWTIFSATQGWINDNAPFTTGLGLKSMHWFKQHGVETNIKTGVLAVNEAGRQTSLRTAEVRYHYRFESAFPFTLARKLQISPFVGFELYRNSSDTIVNQYDLLKFGTSLEFPWGQRSQGGGEFTGGFGFDGNKKYEVSGHVNYFLDKQWSLGLGYRVHLFEAGSSKTSPNGKVPYREGYTEGYSILNYHY